MAQSRKPRIAQYNDMLRLLAGYDSEKSFQSLMALDRNVLQAVFANAGYSRELFHDVTVQGARNIYIDLIKSDEKLLDSLFKQWLEIRTASASGDRLTIPTAIQGFQAGTSIADLYKNLESEHPDFVISDIEARLLKADLSVRVSRWGDNKRIENGAGGLGKLTQKGLTATVRFDPVSGTAWLENSKESFEKAAPAFDGLRFDAQGRGYVLEAWTDGWKVIPETLAKARKPASGSAPVVSRDPVIGLYMWTKADRDLSSSERFSSEAEAFLDFYGKNVVK